MLFSPLESDQRNATQSQKSEDGSIVEVQKDCLSCRLIGFATCLVLSGFCFTEAFRLQVKIKQASMQGRMPPINPRTSTPIPSIKPRSKKAFKGNLPPMPKDARLRLYSFIILGTGTGFAGIYRLVM